MSNPSLNHHPAQHRQPEPSAMCGIEEEEELVGHATFDHCAAARSSSPVFDAAIRCRPPARRTRWRCLRTTSTSRTSTTHSGRSGWRLLPATRPLLDCTLGWWPWPTSWRRRAALPVLGPGLSLRMCGGKSKSGGGQRFCGGGLDGVEDKDPKTAVKFSWHVFTHCLGSTQETIRLSRSGRAGTRG